MMKDAVITADELLLLSRLFDYPEGLTVPSELAGTAVASWVKDMGNVSLKELQAEYVRLFINTLPELPCPPYGSFYIEGVLMGESTVRLKNLHLSYGLQTDEMADNIAVELELLALLGALSGEVAPVREDYEFVLNHLKRWLPGFLDRVEANAQTDYYRQISKYARKVLCADT